MMGRSVGGVYMGIAKGAVYLLFRARELGVDFGTVLTSESSKRT